MPKQLTGGGLPIAGPYYHPKIRSDTCPSIPFEGDCCTPEAGRSATGCTAGATGAPPAPGRRKADAEGASLRGVPTVGVEGSAWRGTRSSTFIRDADELNPIEGGEGLATSGLADMNSGECIALRTSDAPRSASAWDGSCVSRGRGR